MTKISDGEILYRYAKPEILPPGQDEIPASIFNDTNMSCDWERYQSAPEKSPHVKDGKNLLVSITVCDAIRNPVNPKRVGALVPEWKQEIMHNPLPEQQGDPYTPNASHSLIIGKKRAAVTDAIRKNSSSKIINTSFEYEVLTRD